MFDASQHLLPEPETQAVLAVQNETSFPCSEETVSAQSDTDSISVSTDSENLNSSIELPEQQDQREQQEQSLPDPLQNQLIQVDDIPSPAADSRSLEIDVAGSDSLKSTLTYDDKDAPEESKGFTDCAEPSFLQEKTPDSFWSRPVVCGVLVLIGTALVLGLCGQVVFHERDRIGATYPKFRPWLQAFCRPLNCSLSPLRQIEFITIDSSSFVKMGSMAYRLNLTLKNTGETRLAMPAIEVTLTDSFDQPVVRRVFLPVDLDAKSNTLDAGAEWPASLSLSVKAPTTASQITGYRLLAFYP